MNEKLTAYALNELPPDERAEFEAQLQNDPALRQQAEDMKSFCSLLNEQITRSDSDTLKPEQRDELLENFQSAPKIIRPFWRRPGFIGSIGLAAAACVALMFTLHEVKKPEEDALNPIAMEPANFGTLRSTQVHEEVATVSKNVKEEKALLLAENNTAAAPGTTLNRVAPPPLTSVFSSTGNDDLNGASGLSQSSTISTPVIVSNDNFSKDGDLSINGITKSGSDGLTLSGKNTYTGSTSFSSGDLAMDGSQSSPSPTTPDPQGGATLRLATTSPQKPMLMADASSESKLKSVTTKNIELQNSSTAPAMPVPASTATGEKSKLLAANADKKSDAEFKRIHISGNEKTQDNGIRRETQSAPSEELYATSRDNRSAGGAGGGGMVGSFAGKGGASGSSDLLAQSTRNRGSITPADSPAPYKEQDELRLGRANKSDSKSPTFGNIPDTGGLYSRQQAANGSQTYRPIIENPFLYVAQQPLSTFSLDVDTASYANVRRMLNSHQRPPADAVRLEELINYFPYSYEAPTDDKPFAVHVDIAEAPWQPLHRLARVAVKGREIKGERQPANFVFLLDVSGSMQPEERLPLIKQSLRLLVDQLRADDRVAIVTYAGESGVALPATAGSGKEKITRAIDHIRAGGSTNGASGIRLAYEQAALNFSKERINRVILATDGDFNVGTSSVQELEKLIAEKAKSGVFLSVLGVGTDNLHDHTMQAIADRGNGNYHYLDSLGEARKVLVEQMSGTLVTIAKDVKVQIEFNPAQVAAYRLIGYEKRLLAKEDFNNDKKDAGEIGAGHTITALYEIVPANLKFPDGKPVVDDLKYEKKVPKSDPLESETSRLVPTPETMTVKLRYKQPDSDKSQLIEIPFTDNEKKLIESDKEFQFAVSVAGFGMLLRDSQHAGELTWEMVRKLALSGKGPDEQGWRGEFIQLIEKARGLSENR